jgi:hypothetical protein
MPSVVSTFKNRGQPRFSSGSEDLSDGNHGDGNVTHQTILVDDEEEEKVASPEKRSQSRRKMTPN